MSEPLTDDQLAERYGDIEFRRALNELLDLRTLVERCIIGREYKITQPLYDPLVLTGDGERVVEKMMKRGVPYPCARFICYLDLLQVDSLIDPTATDIQRLASAVSKQVRDAEIRYPYTYGRLLYDKAHDLGLNRKSRVTHRDTLELMDGTPQGVFQVGNLVVGPYGLLRSKERRSLSPSLRFAYHCADDTCTRLHYHQLETAREADINESREKSDKILAREFPSSSDWSGYFRRFSIYPADPYDDFAGDSIASLIGDALTLGELQTLAGRLLDDTRGELRTILRELGGPGGPASSIAARLNSAELIQLVLLTANREIFAAIDALISSGDIEIPPTEVRRPRLSQRPMGNAFGLRPELSVNGLRLRPNEKSLAVLRLRRLVRQMYRFDSEEDRLELAWHLQLRDDGTENIEAVVEQYLRSRTPREAVNALLLARRSNFIVAAEKLMLNERTLTTDHERVDAVLWKLGFSVEDSFDPHEMFWQQHEKMVSLTRQGDLKAFDVDEEQLRGQIVNYFVQVEAILQDSLLYTTWCLANDHFSSEQPFTYRPHKDSVAALEILKTQAAHDVDESGNPRLNLDGKLTLYPLARGFGLIAEYLKSTISREDEYLRSENRIPIWFKSQSLEQFPFSHIVPFLDLLSDSRTEILDALQGLTRGLIGADINEARNEWLHPRRRTTNPGDRLRIALTAIREAIETIEVNGFARMHYRRTRTERDEASRSIVTLTATRGHQLILYRPSGLAWLGLPELDVPQHAMPSARFSDRGEVLRFISLDDSPYTRMWSNYPKRPQSADDISASVMYSDATQNLDREV
ncbi:MAG: hypothetical protein HOU81_07600 [Hamadaea sp.]|uniref:hypothetical protein n=1 Tax=Hamadaea sp. TaxID=2024425 RepID=UPI0017C00975|nr:hypothetical protein [Hamadaea sp.]NUR70670.1 hypothetical protein [Hamadaea sp.]NUT17857.1 hypothetical protein [Hamadaea sp.]